MEWRLQRVTPPSQIVTVDEVKEQSRVDTNAEDTLISRYISAAVDMVEGPHGIGVLLGSQEWEYFLDRFEHVIRIPLFPVQSVDEVRYVDEGGTEQTLATDQYRVDTVSNPARITTEYNVSWPVTRSRELNAVTVKFTGGYDSVPESLRQAVILLVAHWYDFRNPVVDSSVNEVPMAVESILARYRVPGIG